MCMMYRLVLHALASSSNPNWCTEFLCFSGAAAKDLLILFSCVFNPIGLEKHSTSIPMLFLSLHVSYPVIQRGIKRLYNSDRFHRRNVEKKHVPKQTLEHIQQISDIRKPTVLGELTQNYCSSRSLFHPH